jgi:hypothetical protein
MKRYIRSTSLFVVASTLALSVPLLTAQSSSAITWAQVGQLFTAGSGSSGSGSSRTTGVRRLGDISKNTVRNSCIRAASSRDAGSLVEVKENKTSFECAKKYDV